MDPIAWALVLVLFVLVMAKHNRIKELNEQLRAGRHIFGDED